MVSTQKEGASLGGIFAALPTAFGVGGELDPEALRRLIASLMRRGVEGFYVGGSTGECFLLSERERKESLETVLEAVGGRIPVAAHVGALSTEGAVALAKHAAQAGAAAVSWNSRRRPTRRCPRAARPSSMSSCWSAAVTVSR